MASAIEAPSYSTVEVANLCRVSFRQLDYWLRVGTLDIENPTPGSGTHRRWTPAEVERLKATLAIVREAEEVILAFRTGVLWKEMDNWKGTIDGSTR